MKWSFLAVLAVLVCCATPILIVLIGANVAVALGVLLDSWPLILAGVLLLAAGIYYYVRWRRRHLTRG